jgi:hypothetical protein
MPNETDHCMHCGKVLTYPPSCCTLAEADMENNYVTWVVFCSLCKRKGVFKDESYPDCCWQADTEGWVSCVDGKDYCPSCARSALGESRRH